MVEQTTQRWHGENYRETCHSSLQLRGVEVSKLTEALGFGSPASQSLTGCFPAKQPPSVWQQHGTGQCAPIRPTAFIRTSPQLPADAFHLEPHEQEPLCWCFLNSVFNTRYLSTTGELPVCSRESLPSCFLVSHQLWYPMRSPWGSPKCQHPSSPPSSSSLLRYLPHTGVSRCLRNHFSLFLKKGIFLHVHQEKGESTKPWKCHHLDTFQPTSSRGQSEFDPDQKIFPRLLKYTYSTSSRGVEKPC